MKSRDRSNMPFDPTAILLRLRLGRMPAGQRRRSTHLRGGDDDTRRAVANWDDDWRSPLV
jgi:hypothetical protein